MGVVVITGANRGIGLELARQLAGRGASVVAICRKSSPELDAVAGVRVESGIDVTTDAGIAELPKRVGDESIDVLLNNAGLLEVDALGNISADSIRRQFEVNSLAPVRVTAALQSKLKQGSKVAVVSSRMGSVADNTSGRMYGYRMSKAAANAAGKSLAQELKSDGVAVVILHPGYVKTEMTGGNGDIGPDVAAKGLIARIDELSLETTGRFMHANGEELPW
ncbi:MAG: SDR family oxidoreductase [Polyangiaceae bacterium]|nr:SDR family oxidoreductase [Polyangiaceae bacterium]MCB9606229.1 SDR family oxidoreductase [Polyangiaceae bacterium]